MLKLLVPTESRWLEVVMGDFEAFLLDHAACERKASANAIALVTHYPDRRELVRRMIELAREELEHFARVAEVIDARGLTLAPDRKDPYLRGLRAHVRHGQGHYFLDRLLIAGIAEARGCERFGLVAQALGEAPLAALYTELSRTEARHGALFVELAARYFDAEEVTARTGELLAREAELLPALPLVAALH